MIWPLLLPGGSWARGAIGAPRATRQTGKCPQTSHVGKNKGLWHKPGVERFGSGSIFIHLLSGPTWNHPGPGRQRGILGEEAVGRG